MAYDPYEVDSVNSQPKGTDGPIGTAGDFAKTFAAGTAGIGSNLAAAARYFYEAGRSENGAAIAKGFQDIFSAGQDAISDTINPETRRIAASAISSPEFWEHPVLATALKATNMAPSVVALAIPGGLLADTVAASMAVSVGGAVLNAGSGLDEFYKKLDGMSNEQLKEQSSKYKVWEEVFGEKQARARLNREAQGWGPAINAILGSVTSVVGPAGTIARKMSGGTSNVLGASGRGALGAGVIGLAEGAGTNAVQEGVSNLTVQNAEIEAGLRKEFDVAKAANAALEGGVMGGLMGGLAGAALHGKTPPPSTTDRITRALNVADAGPAAPAKNESILQPKTGATGTPAKPVDTPEVGNVQNAPTRGSRDGAKEPLGKGEAVAPVEASGPDPAQAAALAAMDPAPNATATEAAAVPGEVTPPEQPGLKPLPQNVPAGALIGEAAGTRLAPVQDAPLDTGQNVPEKPATLAAQQEQVGTAARKAVMYPTGTDVPPLPEGMKSTKTARGVFHFDPSQTSRGEIQKLSRLGRENELLGLGPVSKPEAMARVQAGETPVAVTERTGPLSETPGVEVKAAAGTHATAAEQAKALEATKTPGNVIAVETPENVLAKRTGRILRAKEEAPVEGTKLKRSTKTSKAAEAEAKTRTAWEAEKTKAIVEGRDIPPEPAPPDVVEKITGKHNTKADREKLQQRLDAAQEIVDKHNGNVEVEREYLTKPEAREQVIARARAMLAEANERGIKINERGIKINERGIKINERSKESAKGDSASDNPAMIVLMEARALVKVADKPKNKEGAERTKATNRFWTRDQSVRKGYVKEVIAERRIEGEENNKVKQGEVDDAPDKAKIITKESEGAASGEKLAANPDAKAKLMAEYNAKLKAEHETKLAPAKIKNDKVTQQQEAIRSIDGNPSEGRKLAGNYSKGHISIEGLPLTLENRRGGTRTGVDPETGKPWKVTMPAHYGYIKRTKGADGEHIDAYDGGSGKRHFVIDQLDHRTGAFDEHKVMLRFKDEAAAREAYEKAFSDGKGKERIGNIHELTMPELKEWLDKGNTQEPHVAHLVRNMDAVNFDMPGVPGGHKVKVEGGLRGGGDTIRALESTTAAKELAKLDFSQMPGVGGIMARFIKSQLMKLAADVEVHYVSPETMKLVDANSSQHHAASYGLHNYGQYNDGRTTKSQIFINVETPTGIGYETRGHTILHELVHSVTVREIDNLPLLKKQIERLMDAADRHFGANETALRLAHGDALNYGFRNVKEFIAEAFSNPKFQEFLAQTPIDRALARQIGLRDTRQTMWDFLRYAVKRAVQKVTGELPQFDSVLDGIMRVGEGLTTVHAADRPSVHGSAAPRVRQDAMRPIEEVVRKLDALGMDTVKRILGHEEMQKPERAPFVLKLRTFDNIAQIADHYFGENNPVRKIHNAVERMRVTGERIFQQSEPIVRKLVELRAKNIEQFREFSSLLHDATVANVHPDVATTDVKNAHLGKNKTVGTAAWSKAQHVELFKRFDALPEEYKAAWHEVTKHYTDTQNKMSLGIINNRILKLMGIEDEALGQRIHEGTLTDADKLALGSNLDVIEAASELSKIEGPYVPLMRRGEYVVKGTYEVTRPGNAKEIRPNEFEFTSEKEAKTYAEKNDLRTEIKKVWVDEKTGELHQVDPVSGKTHKMLESDLDSVARYRVEVQNRHVEFHENKRSAEARAEELRKSGLDVHKVVPRLTEPGGRQAAELSAALQNLVSKLEKSEAYKQSTPTQQAALRQAVEEAAAASHGSTRIASKALPRRGVEGYSEDLVQNTVDYGLSSSRYLAKIDHMPDVEAGLKAMEDRLDSDHSKVNQFGRTAIRNEVVKRVQDDVGFEQGGKFAGVVKRAMAISFIDKLGSPAYSVINAMQPTMVTMPYLSGRHGVSRTVMAMGRAYSDISALTVVRQGIAETGRRLKGSTKADNFIEDIKARLKSPDEQALIDHLVEVGVVDPSAGMEIRELTKDTSGVGGKVDAGLGYLEGVTREMPRAIESINRVVTALAAYRLERSRDASHEKAIQYAQDAVNNTQFNYSPTNAPAVFNHPLAKIALQFKKYGQGMYQLIGSQIGRAYRNASPGDRAEAVKSLIMLAGTHMAIAGALGLPTEPFKYLVMGTGLVTGKTWNDVEDKVRHAAADVFGKTGGEVFSRGLPRLLNLDLSRMGLDSVTSFGESRSQKESDVKTWLFDSLSGPVVALGGDWIKGVNNIANGNFEKAAEQLIPLKAASDSLRAYRQATEGKKSASGKQTMTPYNTQETVQRALGFGSGREAESGAANSAYYRQSAAAKEERSSLMNAWTYAKPDGKTKAFAAITKWNQSQPDESKIKMKELTDKLRRDEKAATTAVRGITANKRDKRFLAEGEIYNTGM